MEQTQKVEWWEDTTVPDDYDPWEDCVTSKGNWVTECRANKSHDCVKYSPFCPGEICPGEIYQRTAILERPLGMNKRGTVTVYRKCQECMGHD